MAKTYLHITASGAVTPFDTTDDTPEYKQLQEKVGGDIEGVMIPFDSHMRFSDEPQAMLYVNETGLLDGLPVNFVASGLAGQMILGDVVVAGPVDDEGDNQSVSAAWLDWAAGRNG